MLVVHIAPIPGRRSKERGILWRATADTGGALYAAESRTNPVSDLFRLLTAAGAPDDAAVLIDQHGRQALSWHSFHAAAEWMLDESRRRGGIQRHRYREPAYPREHDAETET